MIEEKLKYISRSLSKGTTKKYETFVINEIYARLNNPNLEIVTQQYVLDKDGKIRYIDLYFPQIGYAIEVDEPYHDDEEQKSKDKQRELNIQKVGIERIITDSKVDIIFLRVSISENNNLVDLISRIDACVKEINEKISSLEYPLVWNYTEEEKRNEILKRGYLNRNDSFAYMNDIARLFGKQRKNNVCGKCTFWIDDQTMVWSPTLSYEGSNKDGWVNLISEDLTSIYESGINGKGKTEKDFINDRSNKHVRLVFLKYKDALGFRRRRFLGVYSVDSFDKEKNAEVWKLRRETFDL